MNESEVKTDPGNPAPTPESVLDAVLLIDRKFEALLKIATACFEELQRLPRLESKVASIEERLTVLERASKCPACFPRDTEPCDAP